MYVTTHMDVDTLSFLSRKDGIYFASSVPNLKRIGFLQAKLFNFTVVKLKKTPCTITVYFLETASSKFNSAFFAEFEMYVAVAIWPPET